jgi:hypothetical protein
VSATFAPDLTFNFFGDDDFLTVFTGKTSRSYIPGPVLPIKYVLLIPEYK